MACYLRTRSETLRKISWLRKWAENVGDIVKEVRRLYSRKYRWPFDCNIFVSTLPASIGENISMVEKVKLDASWHVILYRQGSN